MQNITKIVLSVFILIGVMVASAGCRSITVQLPDRRITYTNFLFDTKVGSLKLTMPDGAVLQFDNLDSQSQALQTANNAINLANKVVK